MAFSCHLVLSEPNVSKRHISAPQMRVSKEALAVVAPSGTCRCRANELTTLVRPGCVKTQRRRISPGRRRKLRAREWPQTSNPLRKIKPGCSPHDQKIRDRVFTQPASVAALEQSSRCRPVSGPPGPALDLYATGPEVPTAAGQ